MSDHPALLDPPAVLPLPAAKPPTCNPAELLDRLTAEFAKGERCHRRHQLETGRLAHEYILLRKAQGHSREAAVRSIAGRLSEVEGAAVPVNKLIGLWHLTVLLSEGQDLDAIAHRVLREMLPLIKRHSANETWAVKPGLEEKAKELFRQVAEGGLDAAAVGRAVRDLLGKTPRRAGEREEPDLLAKLAESDPRDLGEMLAAVIHGNRDPARALTALATALHWRPELGTALAKALLAAGAVKTANAVLLVLQQAARGGS
ncbi:MAG: hypothetical protein L0Z62_43035 [Gemmataceae bacterium]|nr:hypothetical protein [Gemmataceae bacterium]